MINWDRPLTEFESAFKELVVAGLPPVIARQGQPSVLKTERGSSTDHKD